MDQIHIINMVLIFMGMIQKDLMRTEYIKIHKPILDLMDIVDGDMMQKDMIERDMTKEDIIKMALIEEDLIVMEYTKIREQNMDRIKGILMDLMKKDIMKKEKIGMEEQKRNKMNQKNNCEIIIWD